jgi:hypothetical protein
VTQHYFAAVTNENFFELFKLKPEQAANYINSDDFNDVRNFLIFLFWSRHYFPLRPLGVLFHLSKSQIGRIIEEELDKLVARYPEFINLNDIDFDTAFVLKNVVGIVDSTEIVIQSWHPKSFSGKKKDFTLKYQVTIDFGTGVTVHIAGPYLGSVHDAKIWQESLLGDYLAESYLFVIGDKGYIGCESVHAMRKKKGGQVVLSDEDEQYNRNLSRVRIRVENHFADIKQWKCVSHVFRGKNLSDHWKVYFACEILNIISKS